VPASTCKLLVYFSIECFCDQLSVEAVIELAWLTQASLPLSPQIVSSPPGVLINPPAPALFVKRKTTRTVASAGAAGAAAAVDRPRRVSSRANKHRPMMGPPRPAGR